MSTKLNAKEHILSTLLSINTDLIQRAPIRNYYKRRNSTFLDIYYKHENQPVYTIHFLPNQKIRVYNKNPVPCLKRNIDYLKKILLGPNRKDFYKILRRTNNNTYDKNNLISNQ